MAGFLPPFRYVTSIELGDSQYLALAQGGSLAQSIGIKDHIWIDVTILASYRTDGITVCDGVGGGMSFQRTRPGRPGCPGWDAQNSAGVNDRIDIQSIHREQGVDIQVEAAGDTEGEFPFLDRVAAGQPRSRCGNNDGGS